MPSPLLLPPHSSGQHGAAACNVWGARRQVTLQHRHPTGGHRQRQSSNDHAQNGKAQAPKERQNKNQSCSSLGACWQRRGSSSSYSPAVLQALRLLLLLTPRVGAGLWSSQRSGCGRSGGVASVSATAHGGGSFGAAASPAGWVERVRGREGVRVVWLGEGGQEADASVTLDTTRGSRQQAGPGQSMWDSSVAGAPCRVHCCGICPANKAAGSPVFISGAWNPHPQQQRRLPAAASAVAVAAPEAVVCMHVLILMWISILSWVACFLRAGKLAVGTRRRRPGCRRLVVEQSWAAHGTPCSPLPLRYPLRLFGPARGPHRFVHKPRLPSEAVRPARLGAWSKTAWNCGSGGARKGCARPRPRANLN